MILIKHYELKFKDHRTLIIAVIKPWWLKILFWIKPLEVQYLGHGSKWYHFQDGSPVIPWLARKLELYEAEKIGLKARKRSLGFSKPETTITIIK